MIVDLLRGEWNHLNLFEQPILLLKVMRTNIVYIYIYVCVCIYMYVCVCVCVENNIYRLKSIFI